jgi:hypothetical protein
MSFKLITERLFHTPEGNMILSALFGIGFACIFSQACKGNNCVIINAPPIDDVKNKVFKIQDECYTYTPHIASCSSSPSVQHIY